MSRSARRSPAKNAPTKRAGSPSFPPSPPSLIRLFDGVMGDLQGVERKVVFGYPCGFVNGYMTLGLHAEEFFVRLPTEDQAALLGLKGGGHLEVMPGRPMMDYVVLPKSILAKPAEVRKWARKAVDKARGLPPKR